MRLEINYMEKTKKHTNVRRLHNMLLNTEWINDEIKEEIKEKYIETTENENTTIQNLWDIVKAVQRGKALKVFLKKQEKYQINHLSLYIKD